MRKYMGLVLAASLVLSACGSAKNVKEPVTTTAAIVESTESVTTSAVPETEPSEPESEAPVEPEEVFEPNKTLNIELSTMYEGEWDDKGAIITANSATIHVLNDGYEDLKETLNQYNEENWQEVYRIYVENREFAKDETMQEYMDFYISRKIDVTRADENVLSFVNVENSFLGGAHGSYYENAEVFDAKTGKKLELADVVTDYDEVYSYVLDYLEKNYEKEMFFEDYEEWIEEMFYEPNGAMASPLEWNMDVDGIKIRFNPYMIGPWVSGVFEVNIPYEDNEELFAEEYQPALAGGKIRKIKPEEMVKIDTDRDGDQEVIYFSASDMSDEYESSVTYTCHEEEDLSGDVITKTVEYYGMFMDAYLVEVPDELSEGESFYYLYMEFMAENDYRRLFVVDLNENELAKRKVFDAAGESEASVYGHPIMDSGQFALYSRVDMLGTYNGFKMYCVDENGMPVTTDEVTTLVSFGADWERILTSKRGLTVWMSENGSDEKTEVKLPKGTKFKPRKTDGETMMEFELEDGRRCELQVKRNPEDYQYYIDGVSEYDCFEDLPYAG